MDSESQEFWSARDLMTTLDYVRWQKFRNVLINAQLACENNGHNSIDHFIQAVKMVSLSSDAKREVEDMYLSRYACYLVVQNADPTKETAWDGQKIETRLKKPYIPFPQL